MTGDIRFRHGDEVPRGVRRQRSVGGEVLGEAPLAE